MTSDRRNEYMATRQVGIVMTPTEAHEAKGVIINRTIGSEKLVLLDPFLLLDHLTVADAAPVPESGGEGNETGFPRHPHRGIETLTYVFAGKMGHKDSLGNEETVAAGETQFMTAGAGIFHEEKPSPDAEGVHESLQLWLNLPAASKAIPATYRAAHNAEVPEVHTASGATVRVVAGVFGGATGPLDTIAVHPTYLDVHLPAGSSVSIPAPDGEAAFAYVYQGEPAFGDEHTPTIAPNLAIFVEGGDTVTATAGIGGARFVFACAKPLGEPVLQYRSLVLSDVTQMKRALDDLKGGTFA